MTYKIGVAGVGAIGKTVCAALLNGDIADMDLTAVAETGPVPFDVPNLPFAKLAETCDIICECLPPDIVPALAQDVLSRGKTLIMISSAALLRFPDIKKWAKEGQGRIIVPSGALFGLDGVAALRSMGIKTAQIRSTKKPLSYAGAPYIEQEQIDLNAIETATCIFSGNALAAAKAFPANVNVAATLSLAGLGPENTTVEVWADPAAQGNTHEITVTGEYSTLTARVDNIPDPANPKTSMLAAHSVIAALRQMTDDITVL